MKRVKIGVLGTGFIQDTFHLPCYQDIPEADVVAIGGIPRIQAEQVAKKFGIKKVFSGDDYIEKLISEPDVEVVDIGIPNFLHEKAALLVADKGKAVICEKPLARNIKEAKSMLSAVERNNIVHCYAENQVFVPQIVAVKKMIDNGAIGDLFWVRSREAHFGPHSKWFLDPELSGGGVLMDMGCHSVEASRFLFSKNPVEANAWGATLVHKVKGEDNSVALIKYEHGELGQAENSWGAHGGLDIRFEIYGQDGAFFIDTTRETGIEVFTVAPEDKVGYIVEKAEAKKGWMYPHWSENVTYGYFDELKHFITCISNEQKPRETFRDGYMVNCILDACYKSMKSGKWERIVT